MASSSVTDDRELELLLLPGTRYFAFPAKEVLRRACDHSCVSLAVNLDYYIYCFQHQFCLQLVTTSCGFVNSSYRNITEYRNNLARISQNIEIIFFGYRTGLLVIPLYYAYTHL